MGGEGKMRWQELFALVGQALSPASAACGRILQVLSRNDRQLADVTVAQPGPIANRPQVDNLPHWVSDPSADRRQKTIVCRTVAVTTFLVLAIGSLSAAVVDRIAVTVGNQVITETEILREIALTAFLNGEKPSFTPENKRAAADQLVEQKLVHKEMDMGHYPEATEDQAKEMLDQTRKNVGGEAEFARRLSEDGLTQADLENHLLWQLTLVHFIDLRFRPAIQVSAQDALDYYRKEVLPKQKPGQTVRLADVRDQILKTLSAQKADQQLDDWLKHAKATTRIEYKKEVFE